MKTFGGFGALGWTALLLALSGCGRDTEDTCKSACEFSKRCDDSQSFDCSDDSAQIKKCVQELENRDEDCEDALGEFLDCMDSAGTCTEETTSCGDEGSEMREQCPIL
jgi:hypothetical protein